MRTTLCLGLFILVGCADTDAPRFDDGAALSQRGDEQRISFEWPGARDGRAVTGYLVRIDGEPAARLGPEARSYAADELPEASEHTIEVVAIDEAGNESRALSLTAHVPDRTPPAFAGDAQLTLAAEGTFASDTRAVTLTWPAATDAVGVARYRVLRDGEEVGATGERSLLVVGSALTERTTFVIRAVDEAGNESSDLVARWADSEQGRTELGSSAEARRLLLGALGEPGSLSGVFLEGGGGASDVFDRSDRPAPADALRPRGGGNAAPGPGAGGDLGELHHPGE